MHRNHWNCRVGIRNSLQTGVKVHAVQKHGRVWQYDRTGKHEGYMKSILNKNWIRWAIKGAWEFQHLRFNFRILQSNCRECESIMTLYDWYDSGHLWTSVDRSETQDALKNSNFGGNGVVDLRWGRRLEELVTPLWRQRRSSGALAAALGLDKLPDGAPLTLEHYGPSTSLVNMSF